MFFSSDDWGMVKSGAAMEDGVCVLGNEAVGVLRIGSNLSELFSEKLVIGLKCC